ncbi:hypothetical protein HRS9122_10467 [Pyrenophora teres f. teres]|nr:hypothetical protein HRS9122_10467 [Pyrenophora teres f. teres]
MELFAQLFEHLPELHVIVCQPCATAIPPAQVVTHLKERHPKVAVATRKSLAAIVHALPDLAWSPGDVRVPKPAKEPIAGLQSRGDGLVCLLERCWYTCISLQGIQKHCKEEHGWVNNQQKRGGDMRQKSKHASNRIWRDGQCCQRLFRAVGWPAYVAVETSVEAANLEDISQRVKADRQHQREEREAAMAKEKIKEGIRSQADPWLELTGWVPHLQAFDSSQAEVVGRLTLEIIERREAGAESNERPFYSRHRVGTIKKYSQKLVSILCYLWRTYDQIERPPYKLTGRQDALLWSLKQIARTADAAQKEQLEERCLRLWMALLDHTLLDDEHQSALLSGVAVPASSLITTAVALVVHYARCQREEALQKDADTAPTAYELVRDMADRFMTLSDFKGTPSPMNRMLRLRTLARSQSRRRNTPGIVSWDRDRLLVDKQSFSLADLRSMVKGLYETARWQLFKDVLLLDLDERDCVRPGTTTLPEVSVDQLVDQPAELATGELPEAPRQPPRRVAGLASRPEQTLWRDDAVARDYLDTVRENSADGVGYRGVFLEGCLVSFTTTYHKGYSFSKRVKTIHRYVPQEVSELVVYFLGLGRPFIDDLQMLHNGVARPTAFLWEPEPEEQWGGR